MNLRELEYVIAVADRLSFSRAAESCHVSQPTLSAQIKKLEAALGVKIFERTNRRVVVTDVGADIVASARRVLKETRFLQEIAKAAQDPFDGMFRVGAFPTLASYLFPRVMPSIVGAMPKLRMVLVEEKTEILLERLRAGSLDAAFIALPVLDDFLTATALFDDPFYLAAPSGHALAAEPSIPISQIEGEPLLLLEEGHCLRDQALDVCNIARAGDDTDLKATSLETLREMIKIGSGITLMPETAIRKGEAGIAYIPFRAPAPKRTIALVARKTTRRADVMSKIAAQVQAVMAG